MTASQKRPDRGQAPADTGAGIAVASVWLIVLYMVILVAVLIDHYPGVVVDVASAAR